MAVQSDTVESPRSDDRFATETVVSAQWFPANRWGHGRLIGLLSGRCGQGARG